MRTTIEMLLFLGATLAAAGCAPTGGTPGDAGRDTGTDPRDTGSPPGACGSAGRMCCAAPDECSEGLRCQGSGTCCAPPRSRCGGPDECCSGFDCAGGSCCAPDGGRCRSRDDCCSGLTCESGRCTGGGSSDCGGRGQDCCPGNECRSSDTGLECIEDSCIPCGEAGQACCKPPNESCADGFVCGADRTCGVPPSGCGHDGEPCCARDECADTGLACRSGTCRPQVADCDLAIDCEECLEVIGCGWCADFDTCVSGDALGPATGSCGEWRPTADMCGGAGGGDRCTDNTDCDECTFSAGCGWCDDGSGCRSGAPDGPTAGTCGGTWEWVGLACGATEDCADYRSCETCTLDFCGWCPETSACLPASGLGVPDEGTCGDAFAEWAVECTEGAGPCTALDNCADCTDNFECGWCANTGRCLPARADDTPLIGTCGGVLSRFDFECPSSCIPSPSDACDPSGLSCCDAMSCRLTVSGAGLSACCREAGAACASGGECCGYMDCGSGGTCDCRESSRACLDDDDCCSRSCSFGICD